MLRISPGQIAKTAGQSTLIAWLCELAGGAIGDSGIDDPRCVGAAEDVGRPHPLTLPRQLTQEGGQAVEPNGREPEATFDNVPKSIPSETETTPGTD